MTIQTTNPATGEPIETYTVMDDEEVADILRRAAAAQRRWRRRPLDERVAPLRAAASLLRARKDRYAALMAEEMGKPLGEGASEIEKCAWVCDYYADSAAAQLADRPIETDARRSAVVYRPLGVVLAIMPWNFPFWQVFRFAAPNLAAGNGGLLKHADNVTGTAMAIEALWAEAGLPADTFRTLRVTVEQVSDIIDSDHVAAVTLTGSTGAGSAVAEQAGAALKPTVLELGGSDAYVILEDADVAAAAACCVTSRMINSGQSCIAAKRFIVVRERREAFEQAVVEKMAEQVAGDPCDPDTDIGPQAREDLRSQLHEQVQGSIRAGARCLLGGTIPDGPGFFYPPTVLTDVSAGMPAYDEELFGPVAAILVAEDEDDAIRIANDTPYGLGAAVFTQDIPRGERIARDELEAGCCFVNTFVRSDPRLPFGGIKRSGYGRELSAEGIQAFVNAKTVYTAPGDG